ncbi:YadA-like family protein [Burkholderia cenocepacia]|uniref:YadA-like family protein n=3 Tax=Burkholderia cenocepacia TaxID=95486 RepID=UPI0009D21DB4|nr:YadA-like family protein [Burkholderia cenocepacia]MCW3503085.1 YadA-like family protein [Burkholderia cenocepacia]MCW3510728.1 YadA-like family protein [Burkholderia cenocepacia]MCW3518095.1 YadA-like family protein [Burkholderia cenocepacia]MCW3533430.1 YadA-like family protein [Burkholderia cenocepacia]MCW3548703.1 YadA-like family protein [Burkholderia cenocepacia]
MNKSYRTVWNATTGTWTAAAETARMRTKSKSNTTMRSSVTAAVAVMAGVGGGSMANDAMAQAANGGGSLSLCAPTGSGYYGTTFGGGNTVGTRTTGACGTAISNFRLSEGHVRSFQLYNHSNVNGGGVGQASAATEAGISGTVDGHLFLLGGSGVHLRGPVDVDSNFNMTNHRINNLAAGTAGTDAVNVNQLNAAIAAAGTVNPYVVTNTGTYAAATAARAGSSATAIGANASATGISAVALGGNTVANNQNATAIGTLSRATGSESVAVGTSANAAGANASAFGQAAAAQAVNTTSVGSRSTATADGATSLGFSASAVGANAIAVGRGASTSGTYGSAIGYSANATTNAVAIGVLANATSASSVALGERASATGTTATALGRGALASGTNSVALGANSVGDRNNAVSVGSTSQQRQIVNVAAGTQNTDAVNLGQMNTALSTKVDNTYIKIDTRNGTAAAQAGSGAVAIGTNTSASGTYATAFGNSARANGDNSTALGFQASSAGGAAVAVGNGANASGSHGVALGVNAVASHTDSVALGALSATDRNNSVSVGSSTLRRQITNVAAGTQETDAVNVGQLNAAIAAGSNPYVAVRGSIAARASGTQSIAIGDGAIANATDINGGQTNIAIGAKAYTSGGFGQLALGEGASTTNTNAGGAIAIGRGARTTQRGVALGDGASVTAQYGVALGDTSIADRANSVSVGSATLQRQITNVAAGTQDTDAVNVSQLKGSGLIGDDGKSIAAVTYDRNADGTPNYGTVTLGNGAGPTQIKNVADATDDHDALNLGQLKDAGLVGDDGKGNLTSMAVTYDGAARDKVTLAGADGTTLSNVKAGVANMDAVNVGQLKDSGLIGDDGKSIAAVTYDRNADGTPNYGTVTLGNGAGPTQIKNVADATDDHDALNLGQLKDAGLVGDDGKGNLTSMAVTYDGAARDKVTLAGADGTTLSNVKAGVANMDAVNVGQLKDSGLIGDDGKSIAAVTYDRNADGTPNYGTVTLGNGAGPTQIKNVADATDDHDALNLGQLKDAGLVGDDGKGNLTSMAVTYDGAARDKVTLAGTDGTTLSNVKAGVANMDAVNVGQLKDSGLIGDDGKSIAAVTYDRNADGTPNYGTVTLGNGAGPTQIKNVADATDDHDALNLGQLKGAGLVGDDGKGNLTSMAVTYDGAAKDSVTLGGVGATTPVAIHNVKDGELSATSKDAVNGSQLFATNQNLSDLKDSLKDGGVIDPVTGESLAVVYDSNAKDTVTLKGTDGTTLSNVKAGVADMDAVNVSQLKDSGLIGDDGKSIAAVTYDRNADGTPNYGTVTLGNGAGPTQIKNVATGVDDLDAVNVKQLNTGLSDLRDEMSGGNLRFVKVNADPVTGTPAVASGALAVAIGSDARATSANSLALGSGARVTGNGSVAIGYNSVANQNNVVSVGDVGRERKIVNVADGDVAFQSTDAVNGGQLYAALNDLSTSVSSKTQQAIDSFSSEIDKKTKAAIDEVSSRSMQTMDVSDPLVAIEGLQGNNVASLNGADPATATAAAIGSSTAASGANAVAVGLQSGAGSNNSVAIGSFAQTGAGQDYSVAMGSNVQTNGTQAVALGANAQANGEYALAVGNNNAQAIGDGSIALGNAANVRAGSTNAIAMGTGANVARGVEGAMALGANTTAGAANSVALGANAFSNRANSVSVGRAGAERQVVNVAAGTQATDAVNVSQLKGVTDALGGGAAVGADGTVTSPTYSLADPADASQSKSYNNVGDALSNLDGRTTTNTQNITVINKQLADSGLVDPVTGQSITAVTYDRNADGTPNLGSVTLGGAGATAPVALKNVADAKDDHDALNLGQLKDAGLVGDDGTGNLTSMAVTYDGATKDKVTLAGTDGTTLANVKAGVADMDAVNVSQLKGSGLIGDDGKAIAAVTYDRNADGTPNYGSVTLGNGAGPTQLKNVADATDDGDALNLGQLKGAGLVGDDGKGNLTSMAVTYDGAAKDSITLGGVGATTPVAIHNVKDGELSATSKDAVNGSQLFATNTRVGNLEDSLKDGGVIDPVTGESLAVVYDGNAKDTVTLKGADGTTLSNVKAGVADMDAVNVSQLKGSGLIGDDGKAIAAVTYDRLADGTPNYGSVTLGNGAGPTQIKNVADATDDHDAINYNQLKQYVADNSGGSGNPLAVGYDDDTKARVTLQGGADGTTITNVKAGAVTATSTDAINGAQLHGTAQSMADSLGGGATVGADGKVTNPTYSLADPADASQSKSYNNVGDALSNLDGRTTTNTQNITVINKQLADSGLVDPVTGQSITAVTYDRNADGTPNLGSVTLGGAGATTPVALKNVADGVDRHDAINVGQLQDAGLVAPVDPANPGAGLTSLAVAYDGVAKDTVTLKGADGTTLSNVKAGVADMDAVNVSQLKGSGLIGDDGKAIAAVTYDRNADGTPNYGSVTLGNGAGPTQLKNVADATDDGDALNLGQLKDAGLVGDDGKGNLTSMAVTYDGAAKDSVTLGGAGATTPVALKNVADGKDRHDAINLGQLQDAGLVGQDGSGNLTSLAVAYDGAAKDTVTLKGADGTTITNVKAGAVTATSTDAINGAQLHGTAQSVADSLGGGATVGADGTVTNPTYSLADPADASQSKSYNNVGDALSNLDGRTTTNTQNITVINKQLADSGLVDPVTGQSIAAVTYDRNADGTPNLGSVTLGGAGATTPVALKNVADGVDRHDAINVGQLQDAGLVAPIDSSNPGTGLTSLAVTYDKHADGSANFDQITLKGANGTTLSNVKAGAVNATSMDAVNGSQLYGASKSVADALGGGATVDANGNVTNPTYTVNDKTYNNVGDAIENISSSLVHGSIGLVQQDADTREITVAKDTDGTSVNFTGTAGDRVLTGVGAGAVSATSRDAINGAQLHGTAQSVADVIGGGTTVDADGKLADTSIEVNGSKYKTVAEAVQAAAKYGATDSLAVRYDLNKDGTPNYGSVTLGGSGAAPVRLTNVADGSSRYDAVNFGQLSELNDKIGGLDDRVGELERNPGTGNPGNGGSGNDYFAGTDVGTDGTTKANAGGGTGNTAAGSGATIGTGANNATVVGSNANVSGSNGTAIGSGSKSSAEGATAIGSNAKASGEKSTAIGDGANASGKNSVALGAGSVASSDNTVSVGTADQKRTISNLADGVNASDAATKGQMDRAIGGVQGQVNDLSRNAYSGIAAATALTMIPGVDPGKTVSFGIGGATYKGYQAVAFGGEARITQNLKMKAGVGMSSGGNTVGVGASYQW